MSIEDSPPSLPPGEAYRWISTIDLVPGMTVARPVLGGTRHQLTLRIAVGSTINAGTIAQLINKGIECVAVHQDGLSDEAVNAETAQCRGERLTEIFGAQPDESCQQLIAALKAESHSTC